MSMSSDESSPTGGDDTATDDAAAAAAIAAAAAAAGVSLGAEFFSQQASMSMKTLDGSAPVRKRAKRKRKAQKPGKTAKMNDRHFVVHNYHDHALDTPISDEDESTSAGAAAKANKRRRGGAPSSFPLKLHSLLDQIEQDGLAHVISWQPHGRAFVVHKPKEFVNSVMPHYFRQTKITSFQRQLNLYGFNRITKGQDNRGYYHELFLRGKPFLCKSMVRTKVKGTGIKAASSPDQEPDFYKMPPVIVTPPNSDESFSSEACSSSSSSCAPQMLSESEHSADIENVERRASNSNSNESDSEVVMAAADAGIVITTTEHDFELQREQQQDCEVSPVTSTSASLLTSVMKRNADHLSTLRAFTEDTNDDWMNIYSARLGDTTATAISTGAISNTDISDSALNGAFHALLREELVDVDGMDDSEDNSSMMDQEEYGHTATTTTTPIATNDPNGGSSFTSNTNAPNNNNNNSSMNLDAEVDLLNSFTDVWEEYDHQNNADTDHDSIDAEVDNDRKLGALLERLFD